MCLFMIGCGYGDETSHLGDLLSHDALALDFTFDGSLRAVLGNRFYQGDHCLALGDGVTATVDGRSASVTPGERLTQDFLSTGSGIACPIVSFDGLDQLGATVELTLTDSSPSAVSVSFHNPSHDALTATPPLGSDGFHLPGGGQLAITAPAGESITDNFFDVSMWEPCIIDGEQSTCPLPPPNGNYDGKAPISAGELFIPVRPPSGSSGYVELQITSARAVDTCPHAACSFTVKRRVKDDLHVD